jgi:hypothetical protein
MQSGHHQYEAAQSDLEQILLVWAYLPFVEFSVKILKEKHGVEGGERRAESGERRAESQVLSDYK